MTEEQILEWLDKNNRGFTQKDFELFKKFYEEATKELQEEQDYAKNNCLFSDCDRVVRLKSQIAELETQIERLKGDLELWKSGACRATNFDKCGVVKELKAQIEKMKCCQNCSHLCSRCELGIDGCYVCSKWELRR